MQEVADEQVNQFAKHDVYIHYLQPFMIISLLQKLMGFSLVLDT